MPTTKVNDNRTRRQLAFALSCLLALPGLGSQSLWAQTAPTITPQQLNINCCDPAVYTCSGPGSEIFFLVKKGQDGEFQLSNNLAREGVVGTITSQSNGIITGQVILPTYRKAYQNSQLRCIIGGQPTNIASMNITPQSPQGVNNLTYLAPGLRLNWLRPNLDQSVSNGKADLKYRITLTELDQDGNPEQARQFPETSSTTLMLENLRPCTNFQSSVQPSARLRPEQANSPAENFPPQDSELFQTQGPVSTHEFTGPNCFYYQISGVTSRVLSAELDTLTLALGVNNPDSNACQDSAENSATASKRCAQTATMYVENSPNRNGVEMFFEEKSLPEEPVSISVNTPQLNTSYNVTVEVLDGTDTVIQKRKFQVAAPVLSSLPPTQTDPTMPPDNSGAIAGGVTGAAVVVGSAVVVSVISIVAWKLGLCPSCSKASAEQTSNPI